QKAARWPRRCKPFELFISCNTLAIVVAINEFAQREPHRYFINARAPHISGNREISPAFPAVDALSSVHFAAAQADEWHPGERFNIANQRRQVLQAICLQFWRHVTRLPATIRHRFDQCALFATNVAAGTDEYRHGERTPK